VATDGGPPALAGTVARVAEREITLSLERPAPGYALVAAHTWGGQVHPSVTLYLFGPTAPAIALRDEPAWRAWLDRVVGEGGPAAAAATV
jgi:hypothetical protein